MITAIILAAAAAQSLGAALFGVGMVLESNWRGLAGIALLIAGATGFFFAGGMP